MNFYCDKNFVMHLPKSSLKFFISKSSIILLSHFFPRKTPDQLILKYSSLIIQNASEVRQ